MDLDHLSNLIPEIESRYGKPLEIWMGRYRIYPGEMELVKQAKSKGRFHDVSMVIFWDSQGRIPVIQKHSYPSWLYRLPSGAIEPNEDFESGVKRESLEETGAQVELERYLVRSQVIFESGDISIPWITHVFSCKRLSGELAPRDSREIRSCRLVSIRDLMGWIDRGLRRAGGGFVYRADLNRWILRALGI